MKHWFFHKKQTQGEKKYFVCGVKVWTKVRKRDGLPFVVLPEFQLDQLRQDIVVEMARHWEQYRLNLVRYLKYDVLLDLKKSISLDVEKLAKDAAIKANMILSLHQKTFPSFKGMYQGRDVVVLGAGPTLAQYEPIPGAIHIGVNKTFKYGKVDLDYLFIQDYENTKAYLAEAGRYRKGQCQKFYGILEDYPYIPEEDATEAGALRYYCLKAETPFYDDIASASMAEYCSVIFPAVQFALYTRPKRIFLVGCDSNDQGLFDGNPQYDAGDRLLLIRCLSIIRKGWLKFKDFACRHYPRTEIISINPVGLKGLFSDVRYPESPINQAGELIKEKRCMQIYLLNAPGLDASYCYGYSTITSMRRLCGELDMNILWEDRGMPGEPFDEEQFISILSHCDALVLNGEDTLNEKNLPVYSRQCQLAKALGKKVFLINCCWNLGESRAEFLELFDLIYVRENRSRQNMIQFNPELTVSVVPDLGLYEWAVNKGHHEKIGQIAFGSSFNALIFRCFINLGKKINAPVYITCGDAMTQSRGHVDVLGDGDSLGQYSHLIVSGFHMACLGIALGVPSFCVECRNGDMVEALLLDAGLDSKRYYGDRLDLLTEDFVRQFIQADHREFVAASERYREYARTNIPDLFRAIRSHILS